MTDDHQNASKNMDSKLKVGEIEAEIGNMAAGDHQIESRDTNNRLEWQQNRQKA